MKRSELKALIREVIEEFGSQESDPILAKYVHSYRRDKGYSRRPLSTIEVDDIEITPLTKKNSYGHTPNGKEDILATGKVEIHIVDKHGSYTIYAVDDIKDKAGNVIIKKDKEVFKNSEVTEISKEGEKKIHQAVDRERAKSSSDEFARRFSDIVGAPQK